MTTVSDINLQSSSILSEVPMSINWNNSNLTTAMSVLQRLISFSWLSTLLLRLLYNRGSHFPFCSEKYVSTSFTVSSRENIPFKEPRLSTLFLKWMETLMSECNTKGCFLLDSIAFNGMLVLRNSLFLSSHLHASNCFCWSLRLYYLEFSAIIYWICCKFKADGNPFSIWLECSQVLMIIPILSSVHSLHSSLTSLQMILLRKLSSKTISCPQNM